MLLQRQHSFRTLGLECSGQLGPGASAAAGRKQGKETGPGRSAPQRPSAWRSRQALAARWACSRLHTDCRSLRRGGNGRPRQGGQARDPGRRLWRASFSKSTRASR